MGALNQGVIMNSLIFTPALRRLACLAVFGIFLVCMDLVHAAEPVLTPAQVINVAGRQRMLSQRIAKAYMQVGLGITPELSLRQLADAVQLFETQLAQLRSGAPDAQSRQSLAAIEKLWQRFRLVANGQASRRNAEILLGMDSDLLAAAHELTLALQSRSGIATARLVEISGRQRMLSQRLAKFYLARAWGIDSMAAARELGSAHVEFDAALITLRSAPENTAEINKELDAVALQWEWFKNALSLEGAASYGLVVVHVSEAILNSMELVTALYEELP